jgi:urease accessory protein
MKRFQAALVGLSAGALLILASHPVFAHGTASGGALGDLSHPLLGLDHLFMLMAVGTAASIISSPLLLWALGGAAIGATLEFAGFALSATEVMAALAICLLGALVLLASRYAKATNINFFTTISGVVVAVGVSIHAMLHGVEAPKDSTALLWWSGALFSSVLVCGCSYLLLKKSPVFVTKAAAVALLAIGGLVAFDPLALLMAGAGA